MVGFSRYRTYTVSQALSVPICERVFTAFARMPMGIIELVVITVVSDMATLLLKLRRGSPTEVIGDEHKLLRRVQ